MQLERIQVQLSSSPVGHLCRLYAWAERGQTVVIESSASSRLVAVETAADSLRRTIASRSVRGPVAAVPRSPGSEAPAPASRSETGLAPASEAQSGVVPRDAASPPPRVLLMLHELDASSSCLQWARVLAAALQADLDACRVLSDTPATEGVPAGKAWLEATRRLLAATRETRRFCADVLPHAELSERIISGGADIAREAAHLARQRQVGWIVMPALREGCGRSATALARASGCPVLVARAPTSRSTLLVASDVSDDVYPLCSRAAALAEALHAPVLAFHDVGCRVPELSSRLNALTDTWAQLQTERLEVGGHQRLPELELLLAHGSDRAETILQQARREDAEIIIVGAGPDADGADDATARAVVERAIRSVLVVPNIPRTKARQAPAADEAGRARRPSPAPALERTG
jgi:nucleotide-binding universal stress UspA family protein